MGVWVSAGGQNSETIRQPRDRLTGQPQERQHSAAKRDAGPTAPGGGSRFLTARASCRAN
jgi:hypothetical protein